MMEKQLMPTVLVAQQGLLMQQAKMQFSSFEMIERSTQKLNNEFERTEK